MYVRYDGAVYGSTNSKGGFETYQQSSPSLSAPFQLWKVASLSLSKPKRILQTTSTRVAVNGFHLPNSPSPIRYQRMVQALGGIALARFRACLRCRHSNIQVVIANVAASICFFSRGSLRRCGNRPATPQSVAVSC